MSSISDEIEYSICDSMAEATLTCYDCITDTVSRPWQTVKETSAIIWEWIRDYLCCCFASNPRSKERRHKKTKPKRRRSPTSPPEADLPVKIKTIDGTTTQNQLNQDGTTKNAKIPEQQPIAPETQTPPTVSQNQTPNTTTSPTLQSGQTIASSNISQAIKGASKFSNVQEMPQVPQVQAAPLEAPHLTSAPERAPRSSDPPKIGFVETGSIFADRRRVHDVNTLLLENGRFKSPGQPKIVQGPGGRQIRLSFQTGFPTIKSIESRASMSPYPSKSPSKKSIGSPDPVPEQSKESVESIQQQR